MNKTKKINRLIAKYYNVALSKSIAKEVTNVNYYLHKRNIGIEDIKKWQIGYAFDGWHDSINFLLNKKYTNAEIFEAGISCKPGTGNCYDRFRGRIMFPIKNAKSEIVGFTGRALKEYDNDIKVAKYLNSSDSELFNKSEAIFGIEKVIENIPKKKCVIVMEGQFDVIMAHKCGITNAVACSGTALTVEHLKILKQYTNHVIICFDNDKAGKRATQKAIHKGLETGLKIEVLSLADGKDPDEILRINKDGLRIIYAKNSNDYFIEHFLSQKDSIVLLEYLFKLKSKEQDKFLNKLKINALGYRRSH